MGVIMTETTTTEQDVKLDAKKVEEDLLAETLQQMAQARADDPAEVYAQVYSTYLPRFNLLLNNLNAKGKTRVINFIMQYPFNEKAFKAVSKAEQEAMAIGHAILEAKYSMIMFQMLQNVGMTNQTQQGEQNDKVG
jgi:hypothetical protein